MFTKYTLYLIYLIAFKKKIKTEAAYEILHCTWNKSNVGTIMSEHSKQELERKDSL